MNTLSVVRRYEKFAAGLYRLLHRNRYKIQNNNRLDMSFCFAANCSIIIKGVGNTVIVDKGLTTLKNCNIFIKGNNNRIRISAGCKCRNVTFYIEDDGNKIELEPKVQITGTTHLAAIEGTKIIVGENSLFSQEITIRTGDSHSVLDVCSGERINPSKDVIIGAHCWICHSVKILKGSSIGNNSIVATGAIVSGKSYPDHCIVGGIPAKFIKSNIDWNHDRL